MRQLGRTSVKHAATLQHSDPPEVEESNTMEEIKVTLFIVF